MKSEFDRHAVALLASTSTPKLRRAYERGLRALRRRRVASFERLPGALSNLRGAAALTAVGLLALRGRRSVPALLSLLTSGDTMATARASEALAKLGGARAVEGCISVLSSAAEPEARYAATYALAFMRDDAVGEALIARLLDQREDPKIRGQAAEGLDYLGRLGGPWRRRAVRALRKGLGDPTPTVRFWCSCAFGAIPYKPAVPALRRLARQDTAVCPGWGRVCDEAKKAIEVIESRPPRRRRRTATTKEMPKVCSFCRRGERGALKLIAGPQVFICTECIDAASKLRAGRAAPATSVTKARAGAGLSCCFCGKGQDEVWKLVVPVASPGPAICNECLKLCATIAEVTR